ncbi:MAG: carbamoyl-phosphate synthase (glutamine-hydrolyzing) large subunit [bacterium]
MDKNIKKILILGSGALKIGEAGEFDYSGSQAIKALKEEGIEVILINPNIATIQTSEHLANRVYFLPVNSYFTQKVIEKEKPQGILLGFGGQTALNCGLELFLKGVLAKNNVQVLGTSIKAIETTEDRWLFVKHLEKIGCLYPKSQAISSIQEAKIAAEKIGFPIMLRVAFALGGKGSGVAHNLKDLNELVRKGLAHSPQILVEEYLGGWKEIEYEVVRDKFDNCITVCNMENFDPMGVHTGESIVVAPSQTLDNFQYHFLRDIAVKVVRSLDIVGECNIQIALDADSNDYRIIEVNARLSRSSALASKATGYPLAFVAAKLALGFSLADLKNAVTKTTSAFFEPSLDYIVVKIPRWDLRKFRRATETLGSEMKSVGEVMAIGRNFEETLQKALRMLNIGVDGLVANLVRGFASNNANKNNEEQIKNPTPERIFCIANALQNGVSVETINNWSKIDKWFLYKIANIVKTANLLKKTGVLEKQKILTAKQQGFSDSQISRLINTTEDNVRSYRKKNNIIPKVKQIDTLAGEYPAKTNYLYLTYNGQEDDIVFDKAKNKKVIVLGSGAYCIGSSVEFDWCCVNAVRTFKKMGQEAIMINCNPETVSTDYDECDKLYFEELTAERALDIYEKEKPNGLVVSMAGQIPNNLALKLSKEKVKILGTKAQSIDQAEDRHKFSKLLDELNIKQPQWKECSNVEASEVFANKVGYPVLVRPSYVLSGSAMSVAFNSSDLKEYLNKAANINHEHPVVVTKFITGAKEVEIDAVAQNGKLINWVITEHVENAGVHSGDATILMPAQRIYLATLKRIKDISQEISQRLAITGPFNIQFLAKDNKVMVIECNLRASRTLPFISKVSRINFADLSAKVLAGKKVTPVKNGFSLNYVGVKAPQFSFSRLSGADPILTVEMSSTGEVACFGDTVEEAYLKAIIATGFKLPKKNILISLGGIENKVDFLPSAKKLAELGYKIFATNSTAAFLKDNGVNCSVLHKISQNQQPNIKQYIEKAKIDLVINITDEEFVNYIHDDYLIRRKAVDFNIPLLTNLQATKLFVKSIATLKVGDLKIKSWDEYY